MSELHQQKNHYNQYFSAKTNDDHHDPSFKDHFLDAAIRRSQVAFGEHILELGCGDGILTRKLLAIGATVTAVDLSSEGLKNLGQHFASAVEHGKLQLVEDDVDHFLEHTTEVYDCVCGSGILHHLPSINHTMPLMLRPLKNGGRIFFAPEPNGGGLYHAAWRYLAAPLYKLFKGDFAWEVEKGTLNIKPASLSSVLKDAGFIDLEIRPYQVIPHFRLRALRWLDSRLIGVGRLGKFSIYLAIYGRYAPKK